jgi:hypothetical protein
MGASLRTWTKKSPGQSPGLNPPFEEGGGDIGGLIASPRSNYSAGFCAMQEAGVPTVNKFRENPLKRIRFNEL